jgi:hypothetical protein
VVRDKGSTPPASTEIASPGRPGMTKGAIYSNFRG